jgi:hypothetical protein
MTKQVVLMIAMTACAVAVGCTSTTRVVQPAPAAVTQRTVYPDGTYVDRPVVATTTTAVPATTTTVYTTR